MGVHIAARANGTLFMTRPESAEKIPLPDLADPLRGTPLKYLVSNESTLCYRQPGTAQLGVLAGTIQGRDWRDGAFFASRRDALRPATPADFRRFRVMPPPDLV